MVVVENNRAAGSNSRDGEAAGLPGALKKIGVDVRKAELEWPRLNCCERFGKISSIDLHTVSDAEDFDLSSQQAQEVGWKNVFTFGPINAESRQSRRARGEYRSRMTSALGQPIIADLPE